MKIFDELEMRGLVKQTTNTEKIRHFLNNESISFFVGFDPTADSLHVGHLLQLITIQRLKRAGHKPIILIGEATAQIGDPTGKSQMRRMLGEDVTESNAWSIQKQIAKINGIDLFKFDTFVNNLSWFEEEKFLDFLREIGPHFSVNNMLRAECFKSRMENGLSFLEFNYMLMQAFDFLILHRSKDKCMLQIGGDDQWANILAGIDLIHKKDSEEVFGLTLPLLLNSDGTKMGKTEKGTVWLDENKTSPFEFFQFWRNIPDDKVKECLLFFTNSTPEEIDQNIHNINFLKKLLALVVTKTVHGEEAAQQALEQAEALFESQDTSALEAIPIEDGIQLLDLLVQSNFAKSRTDARNQINNRGIAINDQVQTDLLLVITSSQFGNELVIRKGKKNFRRFVFKEQNAKT